MKYILFIITILIVILTYSPRSVTVEVEGAQTAKKSVNTSASSTPIATEEAEIVTVASTDWDSFIEIARPIAHKYDIPLKVMISQAALETGHGTSWQAKVKKNYFGLGAYNDSTSFGYTSVEECVEYYAKLISGNARYNKAYEARNNPEEMIAEIKKAGYATDPAYVEKITSLGVWNHY